MSKPRTQYMRTYRARPAAHKRILGAQERYRTSAKGRRKRRAYWQTYIQEPGRRDRVNAAKRAWRKRTQEAAIPRPKKCMVCRRTKPLKFDHDHRTGKPRGWLCDRCNTGIGKLGDSVIGVRRALRYLETCHVR